MGSKKLQTNPSFLGHICYLRNNQIYKNSQHLVQLQTHEYIADNYQACRYQNSAIRHPHSPHHHSSNSALAPCHDQMISKQLALVFFPFYAKSALVSFPPLLVLMFSSTLALVFFQPLLALGFSRPSVSVSSQLWLVLESSPFSTRMVLEYCAATDTLDHVASSVDTCHADHEMDNVHCPNKSFHTLAHLSKSSRIHAANSNKFVHNLLEYLSTFVRMDLSDTFCHSHWPWNTSSRMDHANKFSRIPLAHLNMFSRSHLTLIDRLIHC